jgi:hypothetical protein
MSRPKQKPGLADGRLSRALYSEATSLKKIRAQARRGTPAARHFPQLQRPASTEGARHPHGASRAGPHGRAALGGGRDARSHADAAAFPARAAALKVGGGEGILRADLAHVDRQVAVGQAPHPRLRACRRPRSKRAITIMIRRGVNAGFLEEEVIDAGDSIRETLWRARRLGGEREQKLQDTARTRPRPLNSTRLM